MNLLESLLLDIPPITRFLCIFSFVLTFLTFLDFVTPYNLYFNVKLIFLKMQPWRFFTNFFYFGELNINTCFKLLLFYRFSRRLEEYSFRNNSANYFFFILFGLFFMIIFAIPLEIFLLSESFLTMILYVWSRKNKHQMLHIFGFIPMRAPYITWFFLFIQFTVGDSVRGDILGILIGHIYYYFVDILPKLPYNKELKILDPPPKLFLKFCSLIGLKQDLHIGQDNNEANFQADPIFGI